LPIISVEVSALAQAVSLSDPELIVRLFDGRTVIVPLAWFPRLLHATAEQREHFELLGREKEFTGSRLIRISA
jgi:hypothetical protein